MSIFGPFHCFLIGEVFDTELLDLEISQNGHLHLGSPRDRDRAQPSRDDCSKI